MGRYYYGDIEGKLWFGVQSSDDAETFGVEGVEALMYCYTCGCEDSEFYENEEGLSNDECETCGCKFKCDVQDGQAIEFDFDETDMDRIQEVLDEIKEILPDIPEPTFSDLELSFDYDNQNELKLQARWCLGHHILECLKEQPECCFTCEC